MVNITRLNQVVRPSLESINVIVFAIRHLRQCKKKKKKKKPHLRLLHWVNRSNECKLLFFTFNYSIVTSNNNQKGEI